MFSLFQFSAKNLLPNEPHSSSIVSHMRKSGIKQKHFDTLLFTAKNLKSTQVESIVDFFSFINKAMNYQVYSVVRNRYDLDFYIEEIKTLEQNGSQYIGKNQLRLIIDSLDIAYEELSIFMSYETAIEKVRKITIEKAGLLYTRHIYPDYSGSDELFYDYVSGSTDLVYDKAKSILKMK